MSFCRISETKNLFTSRTLLLIKHLSTQTAPQKSELSFQDEWNSAKSFDQVPSLSVFEMLRRFAPGGKYYKIQVTDMHKAIKAEFGDIIKFPAMLGNPSMTMIFQPKDVEKVFRVEGTQPYRRTLETLNYYRKKVRPDIYSEFGGLLTDQGEVWQKFRSTVNPIMMKPQTVKLYVPHIDEIAQEFVTMMEKLRDENDEVPANFSDYVNQWGLESIAFVTLNRRLGLLKDNNNDENADKLIKLIRQFFVKSAQFEIEPSIWKYYHTKGFKDLMKVYDEMSEIINNYIKEAIDELEKEPPKHDHEESILEKLVKIDKRVAIVMCADSLMAGIDTTASAYLGILYCLAKNPEKQQILRDEIMRILPDKDDKLTVANMKNLPYLRAVIKEGLRKYAPTAGSLRKIDQDIVLAGHQIPKGTEIVMAMLLSYENEKNFEKPTEFIPERWIKSNQDPQCPHAKDAHPFSFLPFSFGPRMCVGRRIAELELEALIIRTIKNFKVDWKYGDLKIKSVLVNIPEGDLKFKFTKI